MNSEEVESHSCPSCGQPIPDDEAGTWLIMDPHGNVCEYCSENCARKAAGMTPKPEAPRARPTEDVELPGDAGDLTRSLMTTSYNWPPSYPSALWADFLQRMARGEVG